MEEELISSLDESREIMVDIIFFNFLSPHGGVKDARQTTRHAT